MELRALGDCICYLFQLFFKIAYERGEEEEFTSVLQLREVEWSGEGVRENLIQMEVGISVCGFLKG